MENEKIKALGIAPYEGMKSIMTRLAAERDDVELTVHVGDLSKGVEIAQKNFHSNYDVIISRGGTAQMIGAATTIPVIEITLSVYDVLRAIKLAENYSDRYAIVGFPSITGSARLLCDLLQYKIDIFTIHHAGEVEPLLRDMKKKGYRMILCDMIANTTAKRLGLNAILITSGNESIAGAFDQAVKLCSSYVNLKEENRFLGKIIGEFNCQTAVFDSHDSLFFSTLEMTHTDTMIEILQKEMPEARAAGDHKFFKTLDGVLYSITSRQIPFYKETYIVFYLLPSNVPMGSSKYGIKYSSRQDVEDNFFNSFYRITGTIGEMRTTIEQLNQNSFPIMILGEAGSGKEQAAKTIYSQSPLKHNPLITIDCALVNDKSWNYITNHYNSPFNDNNNTLYLKDVNLLPEKKQRELLSIILDMNLCRRNRVIFSCVCPVLESMPREALEYINRLSCISLHIPPLRNCAGKIPTLLSLYLNSLNVSLANQIIGLEPEAMELLQSYDWPYNYTQFKRILNELALLTNTPYISAAHTAAILKQEKAAFTPAAGTCLQGAGHASALDLNRPLEQITKDIAQIILKDCGGNQSSAAKRLGISRTTLWRYLK